MEEGSRVGAAALVYGLGTALATWTVGFAARVPPVAVPSPVLLAALLIVLLTGGALAARATGAGPRAGAMTGLCASAVNLLVLGSVLSGPQPNTLAPSALLWIPGSLLVGAALGAAGGALARGRRTPPPSWNGALARVACAATLILVVLGGLVTSREAGLAVTDWPNSYGYQMFLYPLSRMVGGIYYEHAHRLFGSLVGLITLALSGRLLACESRGWVKAWAGGAVVLVIAQGVLGGLRVTGHFTLATSPELTRPSLALAMVHGVAGQLFFAWMIALAAFTSATWRDRPGRTLSGSAGTDRAVAVMLLAVLLVQLLLGVRTRHTGEGVLLHLTFAFVVLAVAVLAGVRVLGSYEDVRALRKSAGALLGHVSVQLLLGFASFLVVSGRGAQGAPPAVEVVVTTLHQTVGALLLGNATLLIAWTHRLLDAPPGTARAAAR